VFLALSAAVLAQDGDGVPSRATVQLLAADLGGPSYTLVAGGGACPDDHELPVVEVKVGPAEPGDFPAAQPAQGDQPPQRIQPILAH